MTAGKKSEWTGWKKSGVTESASGKKKSKSADDGDSDVSSVLSFNVGIDLRDLDLKDLEVVDNDPTDTFLGGGWDGGEVWTFPQDPPADSKAKDGPEQSEVGEANASGKAKPSKGTRQARPCCTTQ